MSGTLKHHGIKGQKWGVRRFQNKDGSLTPTGRARQRIISNRKTTQAVNSIVRSMSPEERGFLGTSQNEDWVADEIKVYPTLAKRFVEYYSGKPASFLEIYDNNGTSRGEIAVGTTPEARGRGLTQKNINKAIKWLDSISNTTVDELIWIADKNNVASVHLAEKHGFEQIKTSTLFDKDYDKEFVAYRYPKKQKE